MSIIETDEVRGGKPVIAGTRITVEDVVERFYELERGTDVIARDLSISEEDVEEALRFHNRREKGDAVEA